MRLNNTFPFQGLCHYVEFELSMLNSSCIIYSRLSLSRIPRDSLKNFEISVLRHIRFAE